MSELIPGVVYYRMSTDDQDESIPQQQGVMRPACKLEGIDLLREFEDHGISGGGMQKRDAFLEMLAYCQARHREGKPVGAIVCWDTKRFSRANSIKTARYIDEFMDAGVFRLFTRSDGWIDFRREEHRVLFNLRQDISNHRYLRDLSRDVCRGKLAAYAANYFNGGFAPYGFDLLLVNEAGEPVERIRRGHKVSFKKRGWHVALIPSEDPEPLEVVRWLLHEYAYTETSFNALAKALNRKGIPAPGNYTPKNEGKLGWCTSQVQRVLTNPHYVGDYRYGYRTRGAYNRMDGGEFKEAQVTAGRRLNHAAPVNREAHPGIIDRATWEAVQRKIEARRQNRQKTRANGFALSGGLLRCGHCGAKMQGERRLRGRRVTREYRYYVCSGNQCKPGTCVSYRIREEKLLPVLVRKLQEVYLSPERLDGLRKALREQLEAKQSASPDRAARLRARIADVDRDIRQGARNLIRATDNLDLIQEELTALREQTARLARELEALEQAENVPTKELGRRVEQAVHRLGTLREDLRKAKPEQLRAVLMQMISRIDLYFQHGDRSRRQWYRFAKGVVKLRPFVEVTGSGALASTGVALPEHFVTGSAATASTAA
jgi:DNA invertase Pin-like site-specific DNA recombinase